MPACGSRQARQDPFSGLAEVGEHRVDEFEGLVDLLANLGTSQDDLARDEDQEDDLGLHHTVDETGEEFGLVGAEHVVTASKAFKTDRELDVARSDDVLDLEVGELCVEAELLDDTGVLARGKLAVVFGFGTGDDHLARGEDQGSRLGLTDTHDDGGETQKWEMNKRMPPSLAAEWYWLVDGCRMRRDGDRKTAVVGG
eukprot:GHVU01213560.1.p1 GENE.GHVU01213560.1~~GHVU01213560.1.p1  ORF type:complete len:198 (-),score=25.86 GHVU01213560.1:233-826(-)